MKKKVLLSVFSLAMLATGAAFAAAPDTDYSKVGKGAVSIEMANTEMKGTLFGDTETFDKKWSLGASAEVVIAPKFAIGLNYNHNKGEDGNTANAILGSSVDSFDLTVQYMAYQKDGFSLIPYLGYANDKSKLEYGANSMSSNNKNNVLIGAKLTYDFAKNFVGYADVGFGGDIYKWGIGLAYKFNHNLALSVGYDYRKVDNMSFDGRDADVRSQGMNIGLTYLF